MQIMDVTEALLRIIVCKLLSNVRSMEYNPKIAFLIFYLYVSFLTFSCQKREKNWVWAHGIKAI